MLDLEDSQTFFERDFFELYSIDTLIELEFRDDFYMSELYRVKKGRDEYYALDPLIGNLIRYSRNGKALNRVGVIGPGPMEMAEIDDFSYDEEKDELLLASYSAMKISRFKPSGEFVSSIRLEEQLDQFSYSEDRLAVSMTYYNSLYKNFALLNKEGDTLRTFFPYPRDIFPISLKLIAGHVTNANSDGFLFNEPTSSKVFFINSAGDCYPKYEFVGGKDFWPERDKDLLNEFFQTLSTGALSYLGRYYEETENYFFFNLNLKKSGLSNKIVDPRIGFYGHIEKKSFLSKYFDGLSWIKGPIEVEGDMFYCWISKSRLNDLGRMYSVWSEELDGYSNLIIDDSGDFDTPVLIRLKVKK